MYNTAYTIDTKQISWRNVLGLHSSVSVCVLVVLVWDTCVLGDQESTTLFTTLYMGGISFHSRVGWEARVCSGGLQAVVLHYACAHILLSDSPPALCMQ